MTTNTNLNDLIDNTDEMNDNSQASTADSINVNHNATVDITAESQENDPIENTTDEQKDNQVNNEDYEDDDVTAELKEVTGKEREKLTKEQEKDVKELIYEFRDTISSLFGILMLPNGKLVDFSDKDGRQQLKDSLLVFKTTMETAISNANLANKEYADQIAKAIPKKIDAELVDKDRERIDWLKRYWKYSVVSRILVILCFCGMFFAVGAKFGETNQRSTDLQSWYEDNRDALDFGNYLKENNPKSYESWHSGRWKSDKALRDSINKANKYSEWK